MVAALADPTAAASATTDRAVMMVGLMMASSTDRERRHRQAPALSRKASMLMLH
jgi:hypothetical protein